MMKLFLCLLFLCFALASAAFSGNTRTTGKIWRQIREKYQDQWNPDLSKSPFYNRKSQIANMVHSLLARKNDEGALQLMKITIDLEKRWRRQACVKYFGATACELGLQTTPFDMLKVAMVNNLRQDPTEEIISQLRSSVGVLLERA